MTQWFDYRFRGYGKNKIAQVAATAAMGWKFSVHPTGFIIHRAHTESQSRKAFLRVRTREARCGNGRGCVVDRVQMGGHVAG